MPRKLRKSVFCLTNKRAKIEKKGASVLNCYKETLIMICPMVLTGDDELDC